MDDKKNLILTVAIVIVGLAVVCAIALAKGEGLTVNVNGEPITVTGEPVSVSIDGRPVNESSRPVVVSGNTSQTYGAAIDDTTVWTSGSFTDDLTVSDDTTLTDDVSIGGDLTVTGALSLTGEFTSTYAEKVSYSTFTSVTTTQQLCAFGNTSGNDLLLKDVWIKLDSDGGTGATYPLAISKLFNSSFSATGTTPGTDLLWTNNLAAPVSSSASSTFSATSTLMDASAGRVPWYNGEYVIFSNGNPTSTLNGTCYIRYYEE